MAHTIRNQRRPITAKKAFWQFIKYVLISLMTTFVELGTFALFNYWIFTKYADIPFSWWLLDYGIAVGGLCAFLSFSLSYILSQTFNFFMQRKVTFGSTNHVLRSGLMYLAMVLFIFALGMWIPTQVRAPLAVLVGTGWADLIVKNANMTMAFAIQFPMNKWVIMVSAPQNTVSDGQANQ